MAKQEIQVYGAEWCADCKRAVQLLNDHQINFEYFDIDNDKDAKTRMFSLNGGLNVIPTIVINQQTILTEPSNEHLLEALGINIMNTNKQVFDVVMIGAGPAALASAIYTSREDLSTLLIEKGVVGGLAAITDRVDNYPGFPEGITGLDLAQNLQQQAERFGAKIEYGDVETITQESNIFTIKTNVGDFYGRSILLATGSEWKKLGIPGEEEFYGRGVHNCATCDGAFYRDKKLVVVGGGNSAAQEALFLTKFASHIDILIRGSAWRASDVLIHEIEKNPKISVHFNTTTDEIIGQDNKVTAVKGTDVKANKSVTIETDGVFVFIGLRPVSEYLSGSGVNLDDFGFVITDTELATNIAGIFCAGDLRSGATMQIASAIGEGASAAISIRKFLESNN